MKAKVVDAVIRRALPGEAGLLSELALRSKAHWPYTLEFIAACRPALTLSPDYVANSPVFILEEARGDAPARVAGFYGFDQRLPESELVFLYVEPAAIGRGYGKRLWRHAVAQAQSRGVRSFTIAADPNSEPFYRAMVAVRIGEIPSEVDPRRLLPLLRYEVRSPVR